MSSLLFDFETITLFKLLMKPQNNISQRILKWYEHNQRDLPWRDTKDPYFILVSEMMLQQTQVDTVIPYYHRFITQFPTLETLARASRREVLKAWENLGYYARARHLHLAAKEVTERMGGAIPDNEEELVSLPGIGSYTAAAVLSIAFGRRVPAVDGNVRRVLCRLFAIRSPLEEAKTRKRIHKLAANLVPVKASLFNQGIMDLGATICTPRNPACLRCPVHKSCLAYEKGLQETLPVTRKRGPLPHKQMTAGILCNTHDKLLIVQRPAKGLLGGLWKFPGGERDTGTSLQKSLEKVIQMELGIEVRVGEKIAAVKHTYTHFRITLHAFRCTLRGGAPKALNCHSWQWSDPRNFDDFPFSKVERKVMAFL
jgi:A/G-specific adenine glycosylase